MLVYGPWGCGALLAVRRGAENLCPNRRSGAAAGSATTAGSPSTCSSRRRGCLCRSASSIPVRAAPLTDAALTSYHAIKPELPRLVPGSSVVVIGVGGLGHVAVQLLRELSPARDRRGRPRARRRERLRSHAGADVALDADGPGRPRERARPARRSSSTSSARTRRSARSVDRRDRRSREHRRPRRRHVPDGVRQLPFEWSASKPSWGTLPELHEVVALAHAGAIDIEVERLRARRRDRRLPAAAQRRDRGTRGGRTVTLEGKSPSSRAAARASARRSASALPPTARTSRCST